MKCRNCGKPVLPGSEFCSNSCDAGFVMNRKPRQPQLQDLLKLGLLSVSVRAVEFNPTPDARGYTTKHVPTLWEARIITGANGDVVAKRKDPDEALRDAMSSFVQHKKPVTRKPVSEPEDDVSDLI